MSGNDRIIEIILRAHYLLARQPVFGLPNEVSTHRGSPADQSCTEANVGRHTLL